MSEQPPWVPPDVVSSSPALDAPSGQLATVSRRLGLVAAGVAVLLIVVAAAVGFGLMRGADSQAASNGTPVASQPTPVASSVASEPVPSQPASPSTTLPSVDPDPTPSGPAPSAGITVVKPHPRVQGLLPSGTRFTDVKHGFSIIVPRDLDRVPHLKSVDAMWFVGARHDGFQSNISVRVVAYPYQIPVDDLVRISEGAIKREAVRYKRLSFGHDVTRYGTKATVLTYRFTLYGRSLRGQQYYILERGHLAVVTITATPDRLDGVVHRLKPYVRSISLIASSSSSAPQASA